METEKRSEKSLNGSKKAQKLFWWGAITIAFDLFFWLSFVESTIEYPYWTRPIGIGIFVVAIILFLSSLIVYLNARIYK